MDTILVNNGLIVQVWRDTPASDVHPPPAGSLHEVSGTMNAICGMSVVDGAIGPPPPEPVDPAMIDREATTRVSRALRGKRGSILSETAYLNSIVVTKVAQGMPLADTLSPAQWADVAMMTAINAWEASIIDVRNAAMAAPPGSLGDIAWPEPPAGLDLFLQGF